MRLLINSLVITFVLNACGKTDGGPGAGSHPLQKEALATAYTVRIPGHSPEETAILLTQTVYPATREDNAVGAIIICPQDPAIAFTAMHRITHMPVNAPLLYLDENNRISEMTLREMIRLRPDGVFQDQRTDVYAVNVPESEREKIEEITGYKIRAFNEENPVVLAKILDQWQSAMKADHMDEVIISAIDHPQGIEHGLAPMGWNAHMGKGFAWVYQDSIPPATKDILRRRFGDYGAFMYLTGDPEVISDKVAQELAQFGLVRRIAGPTPYATSAVNAGYKDFGRNHGWWWAWIDRGLGWGIAQAGHNYIIGNSDNVLGMIPAAVLGHMGKHGPMLLVKQDSLPKSVHDYMKMVKPFKTGPQETILNYAWIIGDTTSVSVKVQQQADRLLSPFNIPIDTTVYLTKADTLQEKKE